MNESPFDAMLETPQQPSDWDFLTSPVVADNWDPDYASGFDLVSNPATYDPFENSGMVLNPISITQKATSTPLIGHNLESLYTLSPNESPPLDAIPTFSPAVDGASLNHLQKPKVTGTRKNITSDSLVPLEAPTLPRTYNTPSATSRKELPMVFARKRARHTSFVDEDDELDAEIALLNEPPSQNEADAIAAKRRQNTLAARRSRKRKLDHQRFLEDAIEQAKAEKEVWQRRAIMCQNQLASMGVSVTWADDS